MCELEAVQSDPENVQVRVANGEDAPLTRMRTKSAARIGATNSFKSVAREARSKDFRVW